jgi:hypothetical protein
LQVKTAGVVDLMEDFLKANDRFRFAGLQRNGDRRQWFAQLDWPDIGFRPG